MRVRTDVGSPTPAQESTRRRTRTVPAAAMAVVAGVLALVVPLLAAPTAAGQPAGAVALDVSRATYRLEVVTANLDGAEHATGGDKLGTVQRVVRGTDPDVVMMQEVCWKHFQRFIDAHRDWIAPGETWRDHFRFQKLRRHSKCARSGPGQRHGLVLASRHRLSSVSARKLPNPGGGTPHVFRVLCADVAVRGTLLRFADDAVRACTTQLRAGRGRSGGAGPARQVQASAVRNAVAPYVVNDRAAVVLGGDFNASPQKGTMSQLYRLSRKGYLTNKRGLFYEADQTGSYAATPAGAKVGIEQVVCRATPQVCRWGRPTHRSRGAAHKLDYLFFGMNRAQPTASTGLFGTRQHLGGDVVRSPSATHEVYVGWADLSLDLS